MFSSAVRVGRRLKDWKMKPSWSRRTAVSCLSFIPDRSCPAMKTLPEVGGVQARQAVQEGGLA